MHIITFPLGPLETNCFLVHNGKEAIVIDPGGKPTRVISYLQAHNLTLTRILCTHLHFDHTLGIHDLVEALKVPVYASEGDRFMLDSEMGRGGVWGYPPVGAYIFQGIEPGETSFLGSRCLVLATPGHSPGGLSFYFPDLKAVFSGDTLFYRSIGRSDFQGGELVLLLKSISDRLFTLPEDTKVYSGHGPVTTIGDERRNNPFAGDFRRF
jgi:glyoxylase-like metal-dependent hydrolase (beta-lactamase superfamily II)